MMLYESKPPLGLGFRLGAGLPPGAAFPFELGVGFVIIPEGGVIVDGFVLVVDAVYLLLEETQWEYWLHKVTAMSFKDYCEACKEKDHSYGMTDSDVSRVKEMSKRILNKINPGRG